MPRKKPRRMPAATRELMKRAQAARVEVRKCEFCPNEFRAYKKGGRTACNRCRAAIHQGRPPGEPLVSPSKSGPKKQLGGKVKPELHALVHSPETLEKFGARNGWEVVEWALAEKLGRMDLASRQPGEGEG